LHKPVDWSNYSWHVNNANKEQTTINSTKTFFIKGTPPAKIKHNVYVLGNKTPLLNHSNKADFWTRESERTFLDKYINRFNCLAYLHYISRGLTDCCIFSLLH
jgi:hypothetical protein